jgi:anti-sigma factor RsiW
MHHETDWTPEESRYVDGALDAEAARRLEARLAADPERARRLRAWAASMDLWREDARRRAARGAPDELASAVLADGDADARAARSLNRYAAAALVLLGLGTVGAALLGPPTTSHDHPPAQALLHRIEAERMQLEVDRAVLSFSPEGNDR